jgi:peptidoglycan/LPS O-acetylase OafA/YrhL
VPASDLPEPPTRLMPAVQVPVPALRRASRPVPPSPGRNPAHRPASDGPPAPHGAEPGQQAGPRPDIQGLRAVAVGLVVLYHLRPDVLGGGFVGVDVFFVISGFLIVGSLAREAARTGTISLRDFYARRVRRLLPASTVVLIAVMVATVALMPPSRWQTTAQGLLASVLQAQNWWQAFNSGYAAATAAVSPLQHYWSLAVEEQFYLVAPLLLIGACWLSARSGRSRRTLIVGVVAALALVSFIHSVTFSWSQHDVAYFATTTRMWELAAGGLLALLGGRLRLSAAVRAAAGWTGLTAIAGSALTFHTTMAFPGWIALAPVLGTLLVLLSGQPDATVGTQTGITQRVLGSRPFTYVGDISYSLYLWHWPVIVFWVFWVHRPPTKIECAVLLVTAVLLAHLSTRYVEAPFRHARPRGGTPHTTRSARQGALRLVVALTVVSVASGVGPWLYVQHRTADLGDQRLDAQHPGGAGVLPDELPTATGIAVIPDPTLAAEDTPFMQEGCVAFDPRQMDADSCLYGDITSPLTVVLAGDSHAGQFTTPLTAVAESQGWRLQTMVRNGCPFMAAPILISGQPDWDCATANQLSVQRLVETKPQVVVTTAMRPEGYESALDWSWNSESDLVDGYLRLWAPLLDAGIRVVVIRDMPSPDYIGPECVELEGPDSPECSLTRAEADQQSDPLLVAARQADGVQVVDLTDHLCNRDICPGVVGNVLVYRDNHLTDTFALSLAPALRAALSGIV